MHITVSLAGRNVPEYHKLSIVWLTPCPCDQNSSKSSLSLLFVTGDAPERNIDAALLKKGRDCAWCQGVLLALYRHAGWLLRFVSVKDGMVVRSSLTTRSIQFVYYEHRRFHRQFGRVVLGAGLRCPEERGFEPYRSQSFLRNTRSINIKPVTSA